MSWSVGYRGPTSGAKAALEAQCNQNVANGHMTPVQVAIVMRMLKDHRLSDQVEVNCHGHVDDKSCHATYSVRS